MKNLISLNKLYDIIKSKNLDKYILNLGYSNRKNKKYFVKTIDNNIIHFGDTRYEDYLIHNDNIRREQFRTRFNKLYQKNKNNYNAPIFWAYILW